jgi:3-hydroxy-9,10-secoandrosta-1,3,5(10)-triene-9,17-dione monooxygenase
MADRGFGAVSRDVDRNTVEAAEKLLPLLKKNAAEAERAKHLPAANIEALEAAGLTRLTTPARFGGLQASLATEFEVTRTIATACGSTAWVTALYALCGYWASLFPDPVQEQVFSDPGARVAGVSTPAGTIEPANGGFLLNGSWPWNTGVLHSTWNVLATLHPQENGSMAPYLVLVPTREMTVLDDWNMSGMSGTGSNTSVATDVFVPTERAMFFPPLLAGTHASNLNRGEVEYSYAVFPFLLLASAGTLVGMAQGALQSFLERAPNRATSFENLEPQATSLVIQYQIGEIDMLIKSALALVRDAISTVQQHASEGSGMTPQDRIDVRAAVAYVTRCSTKAATNLSRIGGASAFRLDVTGQRMNRDLAVLSNHALLNYEANLGLLGASLVGNPVESFFL